MPIPGQPLGKRLMLAARAADPAQGGELTAEVVRQPLSHYPPEHLEIHLKQVLGGEP